MPGGMNRRRDDWIAQERLRGQSPAAPPVKPCWVRLDSGRVPGLLLEWRRTPAGWQGRVVRPALDSTGTSWYVVEDWITAEMLEEG